MRRAAAIVLGTMTGTALLVGAKYGAPPAESRSTEADGVVVTDGSPEPGATPGSAPAAGAPSTSAKPGQSAPASGAPSGAASPTPPKTTTTPAQPAGLKDGSYKASATVAGGHGTLSMTVTISGGKITAIAASESGGETNCYHSACNTLIPEALTAQSASVAAVSHATHTSTAFKSALSAVLNSAKA